MSVQDDVIGDVIAERQRQDKLFGRAGTCASPSMAHTLKLAILAEEFGEVARELCEAAHDIRPPGPNLRTELVQVAAVAIAWAEALPVSLPNEDFLGWRAEPATHT